MKLIFATGNKHKVIEAEKALNGKVDIVSLKEVGIFDDIPENENTIEGNALAKMRYVFDRTQKNCFADDTGLEVEALNGEPGVYSARYAGEGCKFEDNMTKLLKNLEGVKNRKARFVTVIALNYEGKVHTFEGYVYGEICNSTEGRTGFGYDPIFRPNNFDITFAEMDLTQKNKISHRGLALKKLVEFLDNIK